MSALSVLTAGRALTRGEKVDIAEDLARSGAPIVDIARHSGLPLPEARIFWNKHHPAEADISRLKRQRIHESEWLRNTKALLASKADGSSDA